ncbi:hypothetical protein BJ742DRAFT_303549 [Cladochytrium replicatum]|nr:hypothetical protein BJ742DRAFT_303549 [Cladochytrium replicatum]
MDSDPWADTDNAWSDYRSPVAQQNPFAATSTAAFFSIEPAIPEPADLADVSLDPEPILNTTAVDDAIRRMSLAMPPPIEKEIEPTPQSRLFAESTNPLDQNQFGSPLHSTSGFGHPDSLAKPPSPLPSLITAAASFYDPHPTAVSPTNPTAAMDSPWGPPSSAAISPFAQTSSVRQSVPTQQPPQQQQRRSARTSVKPKRTSFVGSRASASAVANPLMDVPNPLMAAPYAPPKPVTPVASPSPRPANIEPAPVSSSPPQPSSPLLSAPSSPLQRSFSPRPLSPFLQPFGNLSMYDGDASNASDNASIAPIAPSEHGDDSFSHVGNGVVRVGVVRDLGPLGEKVEDDPLQSERWGSAAEGSKENEAGMRDREVGLKWCDLARYFG